MSDYISKSALVETLKNPPLHCSLVGITMDDVFAMIDERPTLSETEIIRKAFERVVERLGEEKGRFNGESAEFWTYRRAIEIIKEECGISE